MNTHILINSKTEEVIAVYDSLPSKIRIPSIKLSVHSPKLGVLTPEYSLLEEVTIDIGGDVYVNETIETNETQYRITKNYRSFTQEELDEDEINKLSDAKQKRIDEIKQEATTQRRALLPEGTDLLEVAFDAIAIVNDKGKGKSLNPRKQQINTLLETIEPQRESISNKEDIALTAINSATTVEEVEAVTL